MRFIDASVPRFVVAGTMNTGLTYIAYLALLRISTYRVAFTLAFAMGILVSYLFNARFVFQRPTSWPSFLRFMLIYVVQYVLGLLIVSLCVEWLDMTAMLAPLIALAVTVPLTYLLSRTLFVGRQPL
jgi:putative flippase GtrA